MDDCIKCLTCESTHLHPVSVEVIHAGTKGGVVLVSNEGVEVKPQGGIDRDGRGTITKLLFACEECAALTEIEYQFAKGATYVSEREIWRDGYDEEMRDWPVDTIWRD